MSAGENGTVMAEFPTKTADPLSVRRLFICILLYSETASLKVRDKYSEHPGNIKSRMRDLQKETFSFVRSIISS